MGFVCWTVARDIAERGRRSAATSYADTVSHRPVPLSKHTMDNPGLPPAPQQQSTSFIKKEAVAQITLKLKQEEQDRRDKERFSDEAAAAGIDKIKRELDHELRQYNDIRGEGVASFIAQFEPLKDLKTCIARYSSHWLP